MMYKCLSLFMLSLPVLQLGCAAGVDDGKSSTKDTKPSGKEKESATTVAPTTKPVTQSTTAKPVTTKASGCTAVLSYSTSPVTLESTTLTSKGYKVTQKDCDKVTNPQNSKDKFVLKPTHGKEAFVPEDKCTGQNENWLTQVCQKGCIAILAEGTKPVVLTLGDSKMGWSTKKAHCLGLQNLTNRDLEYVQTANLYKKVPQDECFTNKVVSAPACQLPCYIKMKNGAIEPMEPVISNRVKVFKVPNSECSNADQFSRSHIEVVVNTHTCSSDKQNPIAFDMNKHCTLTR